MKFNFLALYGLILLVSISSSEQLLNLVYSQSDNVSNPTNIDTEINNLLNKVGRGNIIDSTIDSLMQGMGSSPSSNASSSSSSSSSSSLLNSLLPPSSSSSSSSPPTSRPLTDSSGPNSSVSSSSALNSLLPPSSSSSSSSSADTSSSMPNTSNVVNSEIMSIFKNQDSSQSSSSQSSVTVNQVKNQNMKYFAKIVDKKSNNEDIISSNSLTEFNNELLKFCLESGLDSYSCSSIIQDSLQSAQFTSTYMGPATVNTDLIGYSLELKIK
jgi:hypothetical protein